MMSWWCRWHGMRAGAMWKGGSSVMGEMVAAVSWMGWWWCHGASWWCWCHDQGQPGSAGAMGGVVPVPSRLLGTAEAANWPIPWNSHGPHSTVIIATILPTSSSL